MSVIWYNKALTVHDLEGLGKDTMGEYLGMKFTEVGPNYLKASMPVDSRTRQPYGLLHGGASVALAETLGSVASAYVVNHETMMCVGLEINANHIKSVRDGFVTGTATPVHLGATTHVWDIRLHDDRGSLVCISRLTVAIRPRKQRVGV